MPKARPKDEELEPISEERVIERYIRYTMDLHEPVSCFLEEAELRFSGWTESVGRDNGKIRFTLEVDTKSLSPADLKRKVLLAIDRIIRLSFYTQDVLFFADSRLVSAGGTTVTLEIRGPLYKLQRRAALRLKLDDPKLCRLEIDGKAYVPYDISAVGISVMFSLDDEDRFSRRQVVPAAILTFGKYSAVLDLTVSSKSRVKQHRTEVVKVGFRFEKLPTGIEQEIAKEAYLYTHKVWSRRI